MGEPSDWRERIMRRARARPRPASMRPVLIIATVCLVIFIGLALWVQTWRVGRIERPTDSEVVHRLAEAWAERWPAVPGPPALYREQAAAAWRRHDVDEAFRRLGMALALDPDDVGTLLELAILSARLPDHPGALDAEALEAVVSVARVVAPEHPLLCAAEAWRDLGAGRAEAAAARLDAEDCADTVEARQARLRALVALGRDPREVARAVAAEAPWDGTACEIAAGAALDAGRLAEAERVLDRCAATGLATRALLRERARLLDTLGRPAEAAEAWRRAGAALHALAVLVRDEPAAVRPEDLAILDDPVPAAAVHAVWAGLLLRRPALVRDGLARLQADDEDGPVPAYARAAALLSLDRPDEALAALEGIEGPRAELLRARALAAAGRDDRAAVAFAAALQDRPNDLALHRERLAWLARAGDAAGQRAALEALAGVDPVVALYREVERDRDAPWPALAPSPWPDPAVLAVPGGAELLSAAATGVGRPTGPWAVAVDRFRLARGGLASRAGRAAWEALADHLAAHPDDRLTRVVLAHALDPAADRAELARLVAGFDPDDAEPGVLSARARLAWAEGRVEEADRLWTAILEAWPDMAGAARARYALETASGPAGSDPAGRRLPP